MNDYHKSKDVIIKEKNVIAAVINDEVDDLIPFLNEEDASRILAFQKAFWLHVDDLAYANAYQFNRGNKKYPDKKDFDTKFVQQSVVPELVSLMHKMRSGCGSKEAIIAAIKEVVTTQSKIDENRWLWGDLQWNQPV